ncbi:hypothetical protein ACFSGX_01770 [Sphingomonas arantia]|uniref:Polymerase nucleotidyl transferase domain-containing protein n=1 Tax=Sphingomonas arantia TaxID=1460676 RepID=A0ABW4TW90_9SPHN
MKTSLILYGSRARGDSRATSDVDLIHAVEGQGLDEPLEINGVSLHRYSQGWLTQQATEGSLFSYHVAFEGIGLDDPDSFISKLKSSFRKKPSYSYDAKVAALILQYFIEQDWRGSDEARKRFVWALRTILICFSAESGSPVFSSASLEALSKTVGLEDIINRRATASVLELTDIGSRVLEKYYPQLSAPNGESLSDYLISIGGIARDSARILGEIEAVESSGISIYM